MVVFDSPTTENTLSVLQQGFAEYGTPREILTDHGTQFVAACNREHAHHTFKEFLDQNGIKHIVATVKHPQTNGKIERFFGEVERRIGKFGSVDKIVHWYNVIKPHMSLDYESHVMYSGSDYLLRGFCRMHRNGYMCKINSGYHKSINSTLTLIVFLSPLMKG